MTLSPWLIAFYVLVGALLVLVGLVTHWLDWKRDGRKPAFYQLAWVFFVGALWPVIVPGALVVILHQELTDA